MSASGQHPFSHVVDEARARARAARVRGEYADDPEGFRIAPTERPGIDRLMEWAVIEPDEADLRSTRRLGAPITWVKRALLRGLQQYLGQLVAQENRFNLQATVRIAELEDRITRLEAELHARP